MDPVTHALTGWLVSAGCGADRRTRTMAMAVAIAPDLDWAPVLWSGPVLRVHRAVGHNLWVGLLLAVMLGARGAHRLRAVAILYLAFLSHLAWDLTFTDWPQRVLWPVSDWSVPSLGMAPLSRTHFACFIGVAVATLLVMLRTGHNPLERRAQS